MKHLGFLIYVIFFLLPLHAYGAGVVIINEIAWMGSSVDANDEWIELRNTGTVSVNLEGWMLVAGDESPHILFTVPPCNNITIPAGEFYLLERTNDDSVPGIKADCIYTGALSNTEPYEKLFLKDAQGSVIDSVDALSGWPAGDNLTKETMQKVSAGWITAAGTPRAENIRAPSPSLSPTPTPTPNPSHTSTPSPSSSYPPQSPYAEPPSIHAHAPEDREVSVGSVVELVGRATGLNGEPLENARFWWNFGDGETKEGRAVVHIFRNLGSYTVGLHVSSAEHASSDYMLIKVSPNRLLVSKVIGGEEGFIELTNDSDIALDIGYWTLRDASDTAFMVPEHTLIAGHVAVSFANATTHLMISSAMFPLRIWFPNGVLAYTYAGAGEEKMPSLSGTPAFTQAAAVISPAVSSSPVIVKEKIAVTKITPTPTQAEKSASSSVQDVQAAETASPVSGGGHTLFWVSLVGSALVAAGFFLIKVFVL